MADSSIKVSGPVSVQSDSKYRVALELMEKISAYDTGTKDKKYWLTLYSQSLRVVNGVDLKSILQEG